MLRGSQEEVPEEQLPTTLLALWRYQEATDLYFLWHIFTLP